MRLLVAFLLLSAIHAATRKIHSKSHNKSHHLEEDWVVHNGKVVGLVTGATFGTTHEFLSMDAFFELNALLHQSFKDSPFDVSLDPEYKTEDATDILKIGTRYNDMPDEIDRNGGWCSEKTASIPKFAARFFVQHSDSVTGQSHHGCKQHWHSMCPISETGVDLTFTNLDVKSIIYGQLQEWWDRAVVLYHESVVSGKEKLNPDDATARKQCALFNIGRILHAVQDSFAMGHVVRAPTDYGSNCGGVVMFQGYGLQDSGKHGKLDNHEEGGKDNYNCAKVASKNVLFQFAMCNAYLRILENPKSKEDGTLDKFMLSIGNPCEMYDSVSSMETSSAAFSSVLNEIYMFHDHAEVLTENLKAVGEQWKPYVPISSFAGGSLVSLAKPDSLGDYVKRTLRFKKGAQVVEKHVFQKVTAKHKYKPDVVICGTKYRTLTESVVHKVQKWGMRKAAAMNEAAWNAWKSTKETTKSTWDAAHKGTKSTLDAAKKRWNKLWE